MTLETLIMFIALILIVIGLNIYKAFKRDAYDTLVEDIITDITDVLTQVITSTNADSKGMVPLELEQIKHKLSSLKKERM